MNNHIDQANPVTFLEKKIQDEMKHGETLAKKALKFVLFLVGGFEISENFYKSKSLSNERFSQ